jgi:hypothetical protein
MRRRHVKQIEAAGETPGCGAAREVVRVREHPVQVEPHRREPMGCEVVAQLGLDPATLVPRHLLESDEPLERVRNLQRAERAAAPTAGGIRRFVERRTSKARIR